MRKPRCDGQGTRQRLLEAACEIFAAKGFRASTIAEICTMAGANIAAVNYHFGNKETLYIESWRHAFQKSIATYPPDGSVPPAAPPEERLRGRVRSLMRRIIDPKSTEFDIVHKEMASPTGLLAHTLRESIEPIRSGLSAVIGELLGAQATESKVRLCYMSVHAQCFAPLLRERHRKRSMQGGTWAFSPAPLLDDVETLADHVTRFSLAGIREIRDWAEGASSVQGPQRQDITVTHRGSS